MSDPRLKVLPDDLINQIAAGEVIERPASVVKELLENSLDAGATRITIEVQDAGKRLIRVSDNGGGMSPQEVELCLGRHVTSKISSSQDLFAIQTLGFRGEALPSIAAVSKMEITSCAAEVGARLAVEGGQIVKNEKAGCPVGTSIEVKDLFYNTPARLKFLKTNYTEQGHILNVVNTLALAYPSVAFSLTMDGKPYVETSGNGRLKDAVAAVYGVEISQELLEVNSEGKISVNGLISRPNVSRVDRNYETFFVNGRPVKYFLLNRALEEAYRTLIPSHNYPVGILFVSISPAEVDVNVHPAKREVRFAKAKDVMNAVTGAVSQTLSELQGDQGISGSAGRVSAYQNTSESFDRAQDKWKPEMMEIFSSAIGTQANFESRISNVEYRTEIAVTEIQPLIPLYQYQETYIVATDGVDLVFIDQHAAHERILFDKLNKPVETQNFASLPVNNQNLLIPETIDLSSAEGLIIEENLEAIRSLGFDIEAFGKNSFIVRSVPGMLAKEPVKSVLQELMAELSSVEKRRENIYKIMACRGAIKAGDKLSGEEMDQLIRDLYKTQNPLTCPHGRPTMVKLTKMDFERMFKRI